MKTRTVDEKFMIALYESAEASGDPYAPLNKYRVGEKINMQARAVNAICHLLMRANFIKKDGEEDVYLTPHGRSLVEQLLTER